MHGQTSVNSWWRKECGRGSHVLVLLRLFFSVLAFGLHSSAHSLAQLWHSHDHKNPWAVGGERWAVKKNAFISVRASSTHALVIKFLLGTLICSVETMIGVCLALESSPVFFFIHREVVQYFVKEVILTAVTIMNLELFKQSEITEL